MKYQPDKKILIALWLGLTLSGCSPFGKNSFISIIDSLELQNQKTNIDLNSGGSQVITTTPPAGFPSHIMEISFGGTYQKSSYVTSQGQLLEISISGVIK